jgi:hypothetical protein
MLIYSPVTLYRWLHLSPQVNRERRRSRSPESPQNLPRPALPLNPAAPTWGRAVIDALSTFTATELLSYDDFVGLTVVANALALKRVDLKKKVGWFFIIVWLVLN